MAKELIETFFTGERGYDSKKINNRFPELISKEVADEVEKGITIERLETLGVPVYKYKTQITIHGRFNLANTIVNGYKYLFQNKNQSVGVRYNAIDAEKKALIKECLRGNKEWFVTHNSTEYVIYYVKYYSTLDELRKDLDNVKKVKDTIPPVFIGNTYLNAYSYYGRYILSIDIVLQAIRQKHLFEFIGFFCDIKSQADYDTMKKKEAEHRAAEDERRKAEQEVWRIENEKKYNHLIATSPYPYVEKVLPKEEQIIAMVSKERARIRVARIFKKNGKGRWLYTVYAFDSWDKVTKDLPEKKGHLYNFKTEKVGYYKL